MRYVTEKLSHHAGLSGALWPVADTATPAYAEWRGDPIGSKWTTTRGHRSEAFSREPVTPRVTTYRALEFESEACFGRSYSLPNPNVGVEVLVSDSFPAALGDL